MPEGVSYETYSLDHVAALWGKLFYCHVNIFTFKISFSIVFQFVVHHTLSKFTHDRLTQLSINLSFYSWKTNVHRMRRSKIF